MFCDCNFKCIYPMNQQSALPACLHLPLKSNSIRADISVRTGFGCHSWPVTTPPAEPNAPTKIQARWKERQRMRNKEEGSKTDTVRMTCWWTSAISGRRNSDASSATCVWEKSIYVCAELVEGFGVDVPCVWPCVCVTALPQRTWAAGVETSAGNTMVLLSWWVPPTMHYNTLLISSSICDLISSSHLSLSPSPPCPF